MNYIKDILFICCGVIMASIGLKGFLLPNHFLDGGAMGVSLLTQILTKVDLSILIIIINLPFIIIGARTISLEFAIKSGIAIVCLAILVHIITLPVITEDKLLIAVFGGFCLGAGIGLSIRGGAVIDGTEVMAINVSKVSSLTVGDFIAIFNIILFLAAILLTDVETALYSMLTYISASKTVDFLLNGVEEYTGVMIVSKYPDAIKDAIVYKLGRGVTLLKAEGGYGTTGVLDLSDSKVIFCVVTRLEITRLQHEIDKIDPYAFVINYTINDTKGGMIKKRPLH